MPDTDRLHAVPAQRTNVSGPVSGPVNRPVNGPVMEHAKGALMLRYGIDSHQAFAVIVRWAHLTNTPVHTIADTLVHGICEGNPQTESRHRSLIRWLEDQLRHNDPDLPHRPATPIRAVAVG